MERKKYKMHSGKNIRKLNITAEVHIERPLLRRLVLLRRGLFCPTTKGKVTLEQGSLLRSNFQKTVQSVFCFQRTTE